MNRLVIALIMGLIIFLVLPYLYIPSTIRKSLMALVPATPQAAQQALLDENRWSAWWPDSAGVGKGVFTYNGHQFKPGNKQFSAIEIISDHAGDSTKNMIVFFPYGKDSVRLNWELRVKASLNPVTRMLQDRRAKQLQQDMSIILQRISSYIGNPDNFYGVKVEKSKIPDSLLVMTRSTFAQLPDFPAIYDLIGKLQQYAAQSGAIAVNSPMLHIRPLDDGQVEVMVALPVNKEVKSSPTIEAKRMFPGNALVTEVKGGPATVAHAFKQLEVYLTDHHYTSPAIPFESLITDRIQVADTSKWVTKIYYPVF
ncbi:GyrI-like domain-containing protein [Paraflavitalea sp. CAU 1676]|uniref:GyrI-like domain-containing protein n=1 Tax=Paraflavitalea sp. CAU 1676 TaxID=3032598 RepID=UPI0023DAAC94|nr:GyrI-like domain-containing protein [Paraflavitalea sp. CAU 1676]MDF2190732.1 GyrI-like domain-containing protein [Paraflavitalea sp. CAU 1676]